MAGENPHFPGQPATSAPRAVCAELLVPKYFRTRSKPKRNPPKRAENEPPRPAAPVSASLGAVNHAPRQIPGTRAPAATFRETQFQLAFGSCIWALVLNKSLKGFTLKRSAKVRTNGPQKAEAPDSRSHAPQRRETAGESRHRPPEMQAQPQQPSASCSRGVVRVFTHYPGVSWYVV